MKILKKMICFVGIHNAKYKFDDVWQCKWCDSYIGIDEEIKFTIFLVGLIVAIFLTN